MSRCMRCRLRARSIRLPAFERGESRPEFLDLDPEIASIPADFE